MRFIYICKIDDFAGSWRCCLFLLWFCVIVPTVLNLTFSCRWVVMQGQGRRGISGSREGEGVIFQKLSGSLNGDR